LFSRVSSRRWIAFDFVTAGLAALVALAVMRNGLMLIDRAWFPAALLLSAGVSIPIALRRRAPVPALSALLILALLLSRMTSSVGTVIFLAAAYVLYTVTVTSSKRTGAAALGLVLAAMVVAGSTGQGRAGVLNDGRAPVAPIVMPVSVSVSSASRRER